MEWRYQQRFWKGQPITKGKIGSDEISREIYDLISVTKLKAGDTGVYGNFHTRVFKGSFVTKSYILCEYLQIIPEIWMNIEDDADIIDMIFDEEIYNLDLIENVT